MALSLNLDDACIDQFFATNNSPVREDDNMLDFANTQSECAETTTAPRPHFAVLSPDLQPTTFDLLSECLAPPDLELTTTIPLENTAFTAPTTTNPPYLPTQTNLAPIPTQSFTPHTFAHNSLLALATTLTPSPIPTTTATTTTTLPITPATLAMLPRVFTSTAAPTPTTTAIARPPLLSTLAPIPTTLAPTPKPILSTTPAGLRAPILQPTAAAAATTIAQLKPTTKKIATPSSTANSVCVVPTVTSSPQPHSPHSSTSSPSRIATSPTSSPNQSKQANTASPDTTNTNSRKRAASPSGSIHSRDEDLDPDQLAKKLKRRQRNKESAQQSRQRKKQFMDGLSQQVQTLTDEKASLERQIAQVTIENELLKRTLQSHGLPIPSAATTAATMAFGHAPPTLLRPPLFSRATSTLLSMALIVMVVGTTMPFSPLGGGDTHLSRSLLATQDLPSQVADFKESLVSHLAQLLPIRRDPVTAPQTALSTWSSPQPPLTQQQQQPPIINSQPHLQQQQQLDTAPSSALAVTSVTNYTKRGSVLEVHDDDDEESNNSERFKQNSNVLPSEQQGAQEQQTHSSHQQEVADLVSEMMRWLPETAHLQHRQGSMLGWQALKFIKDHGVPDTQYVFCPEAHSIYIQRFLDTPTAHNHDPTQQTTATTATNNGIDTQGAVVAVQRKPARRQKTHVSVLLPPGVVNDDALGVVQHVWHVQPQSPSTNANPTAETTTTYTLPSEFTKHSPTTPHTQKHHHTTPAPATPTNTNNTQPKHESLTLLDELMMCADVTRHKHPVPFLSVPLPLPPAVN